MVILRFRNKDQLSDEPAARSGVPSLYTRNASRLEVCYVFGGKTRSSKRYLLGMHRRKTEVVATAEKVHNSRRKGVNL